jgi:outer membrane protein OmpA-like peptidoglycan-associated protein
MRRRIAMEVLMLSGCLPVLVLGQQPSRAGTFEVSVGAGAVYLDPQLRRQIQVTDSGVGRVAPAGEVRLGYNLGQMWNVSVGSSVGYVSPALVLLPFVAISWTPDIDARTSPFVTIGAGGSRTSWRGYRATSKFGANVGVGVRQMLGARMALRLEARGQYEHYADAAAIPNAVFNGAGTVGISWFLGGGRARDSDGDGVADRQDHCADSPSGMRVDRRGCPMDSDQDGVADGPDQCANTPSRARVDANGCPVDSDSDGVADFEDRCDNTPSDARPVDASGCPVDSDGDSVADALDRCPDTPRGVAVNSTGCPVDLDGDGVANEQDRCADTPHGATVDANGCPMDSDRDGVWDGLDQCPDTPANTRVDPSGCPVEQPQAQAQPAPQPQQVMPAPVAPVVPVAAPAPPAPAVDTSAGAFPLPAVDASMPLPNVTFTGTAVLTSAAQAELDSIAATINRMPGSRWQISGYWDNSDVPARTLRMSQLRAVAVKSYLLGRGVSSASLMAMAFGSQFPVADNGTEEGRAQNRRVEIKRIQ